jgi:hypothetical protein
MTSGSAETGPAGGTPMARRGRVNAAAVGLLLLFVAFLQLSGPQGSLSILWRLTSLSFDDPATQVLDELALVKTPFTDRSAELIALASLAARSSRRLPSIRSDASVSSALLSGSIARAPPAA